MMNRVSHATILHCALYVCLSGFITGCMFVNGPPDRKRGVLKLSQENRIDNSIAMALINGGNISESEVFALLSLNDENVRFYLLLNRNLDKNIAYTIIAMTSDYSLSAIVDNPGLIGDEVVRHLLLGKKDSSAAIMTLRHMSGK